MFNKSLLWFRRYIASDFVVQNHYYIKQFHKMMHCHERMRMHRSREVGRAVLSRFGHFCAANLPFADRNTTDP